MPLYDTNNLIIRSNGHSEEALYNYLCESSNIEKIINCFKFYYPQYFKPNHKVYAVIVDIYSTREICLDCEKLLHCLQTEYGENSFLKKLELLLSPEKDKHFFSNKPADKKSRETLKQNPLQPKLKVIIRAAGFEEASPRGTQSSEYPKPTIVFDKNNQNFYKQKNRDIKVHEQKTMFHLAPKNNDMIYSFIMNSDPDGNEKIKELYGNVKSMELKNEDTLHILPQTGFCNHGTISIANLKRTEQYNKGFLCYKYEDLRKNQQNSQQFSDVSPGTLINKHKK